jgi:peptide methionine sulfoxide reductase MsrB
MAHSILRFRHGQTLVSGTHQSIHGRLFVGEWDYVRCLKNGECISTSGTHLGHNLPDATGNRYCINLVSVAGEQQE